MLGFLAQILCWIKQIGAMVLRSLIEAINLLIAALGGVIQGLVDAWPIGFPDIPAMPGEVVTAIAWIRWSPFPLDHILAFFAFYLTVQIAWLLIRPLLRWAKVGGEDSAT